jgi:phosphoribosyl 1,2-cyclic phosphodiesterase
MSLFISSLNSGSNGNCYFIGTDKEAVLVDAGISCREIEKRMKRLGLSMSVVKAIFVSHEHADHISGIPTLSRKYHLPVYITKNTLRSSFISIEKDLINPFYPNKTTTIGGLGIVAFPKSHDAIDPHSFIISGNEVTVGVFTDFGFSCSNIIKRFSQCNAVFLEANYCEDMLINSSYTFSLKKRISSNGGHLSNTQALELFTSHRGKQLSHLVLSHLSENNNSPELVSQLFNEKAGSTKIIVASRHKETPLFRIENTTAGRFSVINKTKEPILQLSLF